MRVLGVDPGLNVTGYGLISAENSSCCALEEAGIIRTSSRNDISLRLKKIYDGIKEIFLEGKPEVLVLEELYSHYQHPRTSILMGHVRGIICLAAAEGNVPFFSYSATQVKKAISGSGHASKKQIMRTVQSLLRLKKMPEISDVADALALAITHVCISGTKAKMVNVK